jgi:GTP-binding protein
MSGLIAIVGRPNVGKSALFNRIAGRRIAIVHDRPGVTRDRVMAECEWQGRPYTLIDTGGIGLLHGERAEDKIIEAAFDQVRIAIEAADVIILVVNVQEGVVPLDAEVARRLHEAKKTVLVAVNKTDEAISEAGAIEFSSLGFEKLFSVSAIHNRGVDDLMEEAFRHLPKYSEPAQQEGQEDSGVAGGNEDSGAEPEYSEGGEAAKPRLLVPSGPVKLAIVGRPNVGKSSLINALTGSERVIVSPIPGTTRDAVDVPFEVDTEGVRQRYVLIDTAGLRKARKVDDTVEYFSTERTKDAIARSDISILVIDAENGIVEQDKKIADLITENHRACIIVVNKWDLVAEQVRQAREEEVKRREVKHRSDRQRRLTTLAEFGAWIQERLFFLDYAPVIFTSAENGFNLDRLLEAVRYVAAQLRQKVPTAILNRTLRDSVERRQPVSQQGHRLKFYYATQTSLNPPTFLLFVNRSDLFARAYEKYLAGELRKAFGYEGCPIVFVPKARPKTIESMRKFSAKSGPTAGPRRTGSPPRGAARKAMERKLRSQPRRSAKPAAPLVEEPAPIVKPVAGPRRSLGGPTRPPSQGKGKAPSGRPERLGKPGSSGPQSRGERGQRPERPSRPGRPSGPPHTLKKPRRPGIKKGPKGSR